MNTTIQATERGAGMTMNVRQAGRAEMPAGGFTLIELVIVVAIIAILAAIAYPTYIGYITKTRRAAAEACLSEYSNYMERYYTTNLSYETPASGATAGGAEITLPVLDCAATSQTGAYYAYQFPTGGTGVSTNTYQIQGIPQGVQATRDAACGTVSIDQAGTRAASGPSGAACWGH